ncbi:MAG: site-specific DNA-methyltransferase [Erysipelotrichaceae bacterium]|nr:site-specific DNA-methyltransferase [Erysipelotrichaceae bacterium]
MLGNSYELIQLIPDNSIDCIYTDPPYLFQKGGIDSGMFVDRKTKLYSDILNELTLAKGIDYSILDEFVRVMKYINIYLWCNKEQIYSYLKYFNNKNVLCEVLTWHKSNPTPLTHNCFLPDTEFCLYFREKGKIKLNQGYHLKSKYYISATNVKDKKLYQHPTIKPYEFVRRHILHSTNESNIVLDAFSGSGTTCCVCKELGRRYLGFEINSKYYSISVNRLNDTTFNAHE